MDKLVNRAEERITGLEAGTGEILQNGMQKKGIKQVKEEIHRMNKNYSEDTAG